MLAITNTNFENEVVKSDKPVLIDFWAEWCGPCRMIAPIVAEIAEARADIKVGKINVDEENALAAMFAIDSIPTLLLVKDGKVVAKMVGYNKRDAVEAFINKNI